MTSPVMARTHITVKVMTTVPIILPSTTNLVITMMPMLMETMTRPRMIQTVKQHTTPMLSMPLMVLMALLMTKTNITDMAKIHNNMIQTVMGRMILTLTMQAMIKVVLNHTQ